MIDTNTLTCVYTINDKEAFTEEHNRIFKNFKKSENEAWAITAISLGHEIHRLALVEEAHQQNRHDLIDEILGLIDPVKIESISDLSGYAANDGL